MKRRQLIRYAGAGLLATIGTGIGSDWANLGQKAQAQTGGVSIQFLGHTCFLITGGGRRVLVNPFKPIGCTAGYRAPKVGSDLVLISSQLFDEGFVDGLPGNPQILFEPGEYKVGNQNVRGIRTDHDRVKGKRFGVNVTWQWQQGGLNLLHLGGIAGPISVEQRILMGRPDVLMIPVGGGPKAYTAAEAQQAIQLLNPKLIIPTHYRTAAAAKDTCDIVGVDEFLKLMAGTPVRKGGSSLGIGRGDLPSSGSVIQVMSYG
jgi:L-ascorbate metabolism protein UlaG (beta-lactamase superfamily)